MRIAVLFHRRAVPRLMYILETKVLIQIQQAQAVVLPGTVVDGRACLCPQDAQRLSIFQRLFMQLCLTQFIISNILY